MNRKVSSGAHVRSLERAIERGCAFIASIQNPDGSWSGEYGGPMFLLPMYVGACYLAKESIPSETASGIVAYYRNVQNPDGSIGLHSEGEGCMFTTVLGYAALRMLGIGRNEAPAKKMRTWIQENGTALGAASWGKLFMAVLNLYPYEGLNPILPELWILPYWVPFHPGRMWCHSRQVYLPMAWLYGTKARMPEDELIREIRADIYAEPYEAIDFAAKRDVVCAADNYYPPSRLLKIANAVMAWYEAHHSKRLRTKAIEETFDHILFEDRVTHYIDIGPVNSILNTIVHFFRDGKGEHFRKSMDALRCYLQKGADGMVFNGYNSTALWDTAFTVQALTSTPFWENHRAVLVKAREYIRDNQVIEDVPNLTKYYRHPSRGGWPFSDRAHGWPITDCTAEGLKSVLLMRSLLPDDDGIPDELLEESVKLILSFQNRDGGWASYERTRGGRWLELLNPSNVFSDIMIDYSYVECSSSCIQALAAVKERFGGRMRRRIDRAIRRGERFLRNKQRPDGSFEGSWAVCFTYGTWFGVWGLLAAGASQDDPAIQRACAFLMQRQNKDGGWGEHYRSCIERRWVPLERSRVSNTAWALMALVKAGYGGTDAAARAARFLVAAQKENGDWPREPLVGVFNKTTLIDYDNYRRYFSVWALGLYHRYCTAGFSERE